MTTKNRISVKLKLPLTPEAKATMNRFLHMAKEGFAAEEISEAEKRKLLKRHGELRSEVEALEKRFNEGDYDALEKLTSKKSQLAILASKSMEPQKGSGREPWYGLMIGINDFLRPYFATAMSDLRAEIVETIAPMCQSRNEAAQLAGNMPVSRRKNLPAGDEAIKKLQDQIDNLSSQLPQRKRAVQQAVINQKQDGQQTNIDQINTQRDEDQKKLREARDNELEAARLRVQAAMDGATTEANKQAAQKRLNDLANQEARNKQNDVLGVPLTAPALSTPQELLDQSIRDKTAAQIGTNNAKTSETIAKETSGRYPCALTILTFDM